ncbi:hypothetical protein D3C86_2042030 [compost metagenome]
MTKYNSPDWPCDERRTKCTKGSQRSKRRVERREEDFVENQRRRSAEEEEVKILDQRADETSSRHFYD